MVNNRVTGAQKEILAGEFLENRGYTIIDRNYRCKLGEIDIVAKKDEYLVFVEVKYRRSLAYGSPFEAVDFKKQQRIRQVAMNYLYEKRLAEKTPVRFDVVGIMGNDIELICNAF